MSTRRSWAAVAIALRIDAAHADPLPVPCVSLVVKDDPTPPVEPKERFFKLRSGTRLVTTGRIVPPPPGSAGDPTLGGATVSVFRPARARRRRGLVRGSAGQDAGVGLRHARTLRRCEGRAAGGVLADALIDRPPYAMPANATLPGARGAW
jgi:hypothetical protein